MSMLWIGNGLLLDTAVERRKKFGLRVREELESSCLERDRLHAQGESTAFILANHLYQAK